MASIFRSDIEDCADLREWMEGDGARLSCRSRNNSFEVRLRYIPSPVRYCMAPLDVFDEGEASAASAIAKGQVTTQYILELQPLAASAFETPQPLRFTEADIVEVLGTDTVPCAFVQHEPRVPSMPFQRSILGFDHPESPMDRKIVIRDRDGRHGGDILLRFDPGVFKTYDMLNVDSTLTRWGA
ncbi:MAG: hypothetical protein KA352_06765 [Flavobacteriales bacterium]|nr:hypothetical protein [Flavobacteriales bacterium]